ncbi:DUF4349 domain-containing protein [Actinotalea sp. K2]|uniref:DUF4349 domain-containing protein n=1 Tax=Actinotalea sp. K2 TaxID=2939438 RepID=UPI002017D617|nr:DUF4349 domain-containing protein [Actinotalea sp. K2]MCL3860392.1 DUF4349 domain-containing protein [Actinotalea sp. K2]
MPRLLRTLGVTVPLLLVLVGCSATSQGDAAYPMSEGGGESSVEESADGGAFSDDVEAPSTSDRQVITTGTVTMTVDDPRAVAEEISILVEHMGGHVGQRSEQSARGTTPARATLTVRVPADEVTTTLTELERLGQVEEISVDSTDVTGEARDLDARIRALEISVARLEDLLSRAQSTSDLVAAEQALTERQSNLESLQSQRASLRDQVQMSTLRVSLFTEGTVPEDPPSGFWGGLLAGWTSLVAALQALLLVLGTLVPWLAFAALLTLLGLAVRRALKPRGAATALPSAETATAPPPAPRSGPVTTAHAPGQPVTGPMTTLPHIPPQAPPVPPAPPAASTAPATAEAPQTAPAGGEAGRPDPTPPARPARSTTAKRAPRSSKAARGGSDGTPPSPPSEPGTTDQSGPRPDTTT